MMDVIGWAIANLHSLLGHDKTAQVLGVNPWPYGRDVPCVICQYEAEPTEERRAAVIAAIGQPAPTSRNLDRDG